MRLTRGNILTPRGWVLGSIELGNPNAGSDAPRIGDIHGELMGFVDDARIRDSKQPIVLPGFIDLHVHGGAGRDIMEGGDASLKVAQLHAQHGTTSLLATTMTAPQEDLERAFAGLRSIGEEPSAGGRARILGVHLEGPYINPNKLGAQPAYARTCSLDELKALHALAPIRVITLAPEVPDHLDAIKELIAAGYVVQLGHSTATYEQGKEAIERGARSFTHLFNAMTGLHHREPGLVGAALAHGEFAEVIVDLLHVHPGAIRAALRAIPRAYCVTDSTSAAGMPDGEYGLGRNRVTKCGGGVRLADGTLAGSTLTMDRAFANLVNEIGLDLADASRRVSTHAADYLGLCDRGRLESRAFADAVVLDRDLKLIDVITEGTSVALS